MKEYYCYDCKQLRLSILCSEHQSPTHCKNCLSVNIEVDKVGSERLTKLRFPVTQEMESK